MTMKTFDQNVQVGAQVAFTCERAQAINLSLQKGEEVSPQELAQAMEHTRTCVVCRGKLASSPTMH